MWQVGKALLVIAVVAYPMLLHMFIEGEGGEGLSLLVVALPLLLAITWLILRSVGRAWKPLVLLVFLAVLYFMATGQHERVGLIALSGISHASLNLFLLWFFGRTLLPGREPLVTQITRRVNGSVQPDIARYTRRVTMAWCIYFSAQAGISLLLYMLAPLPAWSLFINVLNLPLLVLMFVAEYIWRITHYPHHARTSIRKAFEVYSRDFAAPKKN
jgi:uncharacterized membrane protein